MNQRIVLGELDVRARGGKGEADPRDRVAVCGKPGVVHRRLPRTYGKGATLLLVENVPVVACPHCGESYLTAETLHEIERIKLHRRSLAKTRSVATVSFG